MISKIKYIAFYMLYYRNSIINIINKNHISSLLEINKHFLHIHNIKILCLDFDGVLGFYKSNTILPKIKIWLKYITSIFSESCIYIISNNHYHKREKYFIDRFPGIHFIKGFPSKPYPHSLYKIVSISNINPKNILMVDDRLLTGILASCIVGTKSLYITLPYAKKSFLEFYFHFLRFMERLFFI